MADHNQVMAPPGVLLSIFTEANGQPMVFYIDQLDPNRDKYIKLIHSAGGLVETDERVLENRLVVQLSSFAWDDRTTVSFSFIDDSLKKGSMCFMDQYRIMPGLIKKRMSPYEESMEAADAVAHALAKKLKMSKTTTKFTPEADKYILEQVRLKPRFRTSHKFFEELSHHELLRGHTGNSVRSRFRAHLEHRLDYVWKTDEYDNLVLDHEGRQIAIPTNSAKTIKNRFTAEDDYNLCRDIIDHVLANQDADQLKVTDGSYEYPLNENKFSVLIVFFDEYARLHPQHSSSSWRDRYRKFARVYGLQKYRDYYLREKDSKEGPQPMKNLTSRASKEKKKIENNVRRMKKVQDDAEVAAAAAVAAVATNGHLLGHSGHHHHHHHLPMPHSQMDANAAAAVANMAVSAREASALDEEIGEVKNSNIHEALRNVGAEAGRVNIEDDMVNTGVGAIHPNLGGHSDNDFDLELKTEADSQDAFVKEIVYLPKDADVDDLFNNNFYTHKGHDILILIQKTLSSSGPEDMGHIFREFENIGLQRRFTGHIFKVTGADVRYAHKFLVQFLQGIDNHIQTEDLLFPRNQNGFWIPEYDMSLEKGDLRELQFQSKLSIAQRRVFLGLDE